jgi:hypothetical protein
MSSEEITALQAVATTRKPSRVRKFKEDYVNENTHLRMELHAVKCNNEKLVNMFDNPTIRFALGLLVKAIVGKKEVVE